MSYRRQYQGSIHYSGTVSYPASEHGGTVSYSGTEPVYITITVDTDRFDANVGHCNDNVRGLTATVVATEVAQVASIRESSQKVASAIVKGFFDYVGADLSQKMKELASKVESFFVALLGHQESCQTKTAQMETDYNRISKRYAKVFDDLDRETVSRIEAIDKPTFQFADTAQKVIDRKSDTELLGIATISANENLRLETMLSCSHVKQQAGDLLDRANEYLQGTYRLTNSIKGMLADAGEDVLYLPAMFAESVDASGNLGSRVYADSEFGLARDAAVSRIHTQFMSQKLKWADMRTDEYNKVLSYLNSEAREDNLDDRTMRTMLSLLNNQAIKTIK